jgi:predicted LPLAT superfamily acyltransferase
MARAIHVAPDGEPAALAQWVAVLEAMIRRVPEQWFNFFDVWSAVPAS